jgi:hypothetical protein
VDTLPLTNADIWEGGVNWNWNSAKSEFFGSASVIDGVNQSGIWTFYNKPLAPLSVESIDILMQNTQTGATQASAAIPAGKKLNVKLIPILTTGVPGTPIVDRDVTSSDIINASLDGLGFIQVKLPGFIVLDQEFVVLVSGYDSSFSIIFPYAYNVWGNGSSYAVHGDNLLMFGEKIDETTYNSCDVFVQLSGFYNCLEFAFGSDSLIAPTTGGTATWFSEEDQKDYSESILYSSFGPEDLVDIVKPEWLKITGVDDSDYEQYGLIYITTSADPLPDGVSGRSGNLIINSRGGVKATIRVKQGDAEWTGTKNPAVKEVRVVGTDNSFELTYTENYHAVTIFDVTGKRMETYTLPAGGTFSIPAHDLSKGVYLLRFSGNGRTETIKALK